jgi:hypothetical protein
VAKGEAKEEWRKTGSFGKDMRHETGDVVQGPGQEVRAGLSVIADYWRGNKD